MNLRLTMLPRLRTVGQSCVPISELNNIYSQDMNWMSHVKRFTTCIWNCDEYADEYRGILEIVSSYNTTV